jgi:hypothetical protein
MIQTLLSGEAILLPECPTKTNRISVTKDCELWAIFQKCILGYSKFQKRVMGVFVVESIGAPTGPTTGKRRHKEFPFKRTDPKMCKKVGRYPDRRSTHTGILCRTPRVKKTSE